MASGIAKALVSYPGGRQRKIRPDDSSRHPARTVCSLRRALIRMPKLAIYPGSFDPVTNGHVDIIVRGLKIFDQIIICILNNPAKNALFTVDERMEMLSSCLNGIKNVEMATYDGLLVDYAVQRKAQAILRGMRAVSDFEYEFQMALMNRRLNRDIQTVFLMTGLRWIFTSSSIIKEAARFGGNINGMVPKIVQQKLKEKFSTVNL